MYTNEAVWTNFTSERACTWRSGRMNGWTDRGRDEWMEGRMEIQIIEIKRKYINWHGNQQGFLLRKQYVTVIFRATKKNIKSGKKL